MRIHTRAPLNAFDQAASKAGATLEDLTVHRSRKSLFGIEVHLLGASNHWAGHSGASGYGATWDQWGVFLAAIFTVDPAMSCRAYKDAADFTYKTAGRFPVGAYPEWAGARMPADYHGDHTWQTLNVINGRYVQTCTKCSAERRSAA
jgi:hypothetical protein